ncbi:phosphate ABC transporter permease PstA [Candidatus Saganbacteria bacterium]|nr:phosphate ABC transporter permease PstA [Candidatus Saganbacteria bacterium]
MENEANIKIFKLRKLKEKLFLYGVFSAALIAVVPLISILAYVFFQGISSLNLDFFTSLPVPAGEAGGGIANAIAGTFIIVLLACVVGLPVGILSGIWLAEYGEGKRGFVIRYTNDVLAGIPSIVIGIFIYAIFVLAMRRFSAIAGGVSLAIIMIPTITKTTEELIRMVPISLWESALALGISQWRVTWYVVFRTAWSGIFTGIMLAVARVSGETAPLLFTSFNNQFWNFAVDQPMASMTVQIFNYSISPFNDWHSKSWGASLVLVAIILMITLTVRRFSKRIYYG